MHLVPQIRIDQWERLELSLTGKPLRGVILPTKTECSCSVAREMAERGFPIKLAPSTRPGQGESYNLQVFGPGTPPTVLSVPIEFCPWCGEPLSEANC